MSSAVPGAAGWLAPVAEENLYVRVGFDKDPTSLVGRFVPAGAVPDDAAASELSCSDFITHETVEGGNVSYDKYFNASSGASANLSIPAALRGGGSASQTTVVRISYTLTRKVRYLIDDAAGFEACCVSAPGQCTDTFLGEFLEGTGQVFYSVGTEAELAAQGINPAAVGSLEAHDGRFWKSSITFSEPVFFAFKTAVNPHVGGAGEAGMASGPCNDPAVTWDDVPPESSQGQYFIGVSDAHDSEQAARDAALLHAKVQAVRFLAESIDTGSITTTSSTGAGGRVATALESEGVLENAATGVARYVKDKAWCKVDPGVGNPYGPEFRIKVATFLQRDQYDEAAAEVEGVTK